LTFHWSKKPPVASRSLKPSVVESVRLSAKVAASRARSSSVPKRPSWKLAMPVAVITFCRLRGRNALPEKIVSGVTEPNRPPKFELSTWLRP
jgi:hypothetical protein